jgi:hypothetical protein
MHSYQRALMPPLIMREFDLMTFRARVLATGSSTAPAPTLSDRIVNELRARAGPDGLIRHATPGTLPTQHVEPAQ